MPRFSCPGLHMAFTGADGAPVVIRDGVPISDRDWDVARELDPVKKLLADRKLAPIAEVVDLGDVSLNVIAPALDALDIEEDELA